MKLELKTGFVTKAGLQEYGSVSIAFYVETEYQVVPLNSGLNGLILEEVKPELPYWVDHDGGETPLAWWDRWDLSKWGMVSAFDAGKQIGGAIIASNTEGVHMLENRSDLAVLWDLRVAEEYRYQGVGTAIFDAALQWCRERGLQQLKIETQTYNIAACKFYAKQGASLGVINCHAYPQQPRIKQLIWYLNL